MNTASVLLITRDESLKQSVLEVVHTRAPLRLRTVRSVAEAERWLLDRSLVIVLAHLIEPADGTAIANLVRTLSSTRQVATIVIGELGQAETGLALLKQGATEFLERPLNFRQFAYLLEVLTLRAAGKVPAVRTRDQAVEANVADEPEAVVAAGPGSDFLYCTTGAIGLIMKQVQQVAPVDTNVLLEGETGTGKTRLAEVIHNLSPRRDNPFRVINCAAMTTSVIESELFGHLKGSFTGADRDRIGRFAEVGEGTLVLDEVDTLPLEVQAKLLRVIEDRVFEPVGSNRQQPMRARLIAASNRDLAKQVAAGQFRADLYYRLNVVMFQIPPLRDRTPAVVSAMIDRFIREFADKAKRDIRGVTPDGMRALLAYKWPGNVRELRNAIERAVALRSSGPIELENLPDPVRFSAGTDPTDLPSSGVSTAATTLQPRGSLAEAKEAAEAGRIADALRRNNNNRLKAAAELGISRMTLYKKLHRYGWVDASF